MVNFLHFSDFHIQKRRGDLKFGVDPCLGLERAIEAAREMDVGPAFSIVTGDISQDGSEEGYGIAREYIREIEALGRPRSSPPVGFDTESNDCLMYRGAVSRRGITPLFLAASLE